MAWGKAPAQGIDDLAKRLVENDEKLQSLTILRFRRLNESDVEALARALSKNSVLQELTASSHPISAAGSAALGAALQHNTALKRISVGNSSWGDKALGALAQGLKQNTNIEVWDLEHKGLSHAAAPHISDVLQSHPALQQLVLSRNALQDAGVSELCAGSWRSLKQLELSDTGLTAQGLRALAAAASLEQLHHLDLSHNDLGHKAAAEGLQQLLDSAGQLRSLKLRNTGVGGAGVAGLAKALPSSRCLQHLDLSCTQLDNAGLTALAAALGGSKQQLQDISEAAAAAEAEAGEIGSQQPPARPLQQLLLGGNPDLSDAALSSLASALKTAAAALSSSCSSGSSEAAATAAAEVAVTDAASSDANKQQQQDQWHLDLSETGVGAEALQALADLPGLQQLSLFGCKLGTSAAGAHGADAPIKVLQACLGSGGFAALQGLNLSGCGLDFDQMKALMQQLTAGNQQGSTAASALKTLELGANPGVQHDEFEGLVQQLREARPGLDVHWRVADSDAPPQQPQPQS